MNNRITRRTLLRLAGAGLVAAGMKAVPVLADGSQDDSKATLQQTIDWIKEKATFTKSETDNVGNAAVVSGEMDYSLAEYTVTSICTTVTTYSSGRVRTVTETYWIPLYQLDPALVCPCTGDVVWLICLGNDPDIKATGTDTDTVMNRSTYISDVYIAFPDPDVAARAAKAFKHAINLSKG